MKALKELLPQAGLMLLLFTVLCGVIYPLAITGAAQGLFREKANGSIIEIDGKKYGSVLLAQEYTNPAHLWGRIMNIDTETFTDENGNKVMYAVPSNLSPASAEFEKLVQERVSALRESNPDAAQDTVPVDLVTCSGSGLDPHISIAAAIYQIPRIAQAREISQQEVQKVIDRHTTGRFLGIFGEPVVNVLEVNLDLDGILK